MQNERSFGPRRVPFLCLPDLLEHQTRRIPDAPAILAPGRAALSFGRLYQHIEDVERRLRAMGIGRHDRIAVALPNGPEAATAILAAAASATCAPINPAYRTDEVARYFADVQPRALIVQAGLDTPARRAALDRGVRVIELATAADAEAGLFTLGGESGQARSAESAAPGDVMLLISTSGTTSRPKIVPETHAKVCASAYAHGTALALTQRDRCLNIMPLFHGHGLIATLIASLSAGASVVCTPGLDVNCFSAWLTEFEATWYTGVPAMHQAILGHTRHNRDRLSDARLRFVRSSSAPLPPRIFTELEHSFDTSIIEWYGMSEVAAAPIACNPLRPRPRKPGSVGLPVDLDVGIMDEIGALLPRGQNGQVVVRGATVMTGYDDNPTATAAAFAGAWLKTGDLGYFDDDGYLFLTGRIREMINRGGEKIAPQEVDEVLLDHPAVAEAVTFAIPHPTLGEDVAAAVVLRPHAAATPKDIRQFANGRIADFKVPCQVHIVSQIPKSQTGKVQRIGLADQLGLATDAAIPQASAAPRTPVEKALAAIWAEVLQVEQVLVDDNFFVLGGDSLLATRILIRLHEAMQVEVGVSCIFEAPTVAEMAAYLETLIQADRASQPPSAIVRVARENAVAPTSIAQERLCELQHALPDLPFFNVLYALRLMPAVEVARLERSINEIVRRHEILRTTFTALEGRYMQVIAPQLTVPLLFDDLRALPRSKKDATELDLIQGEALHCFDLGQGPLIRARLLCLAEEEYLLLISTHQAICDGWSLGVLAEELIALYDALSGEQEPPLAPLAVQFADFAHWQRQWRSHREMVAQLEYWKEQLGDPLPVMQLAKSAPRRKIDDLRTVRRAWTLPESLVDAAKRFGHAEGGTLFMVLVAALKTLLHRNLGQDEVRVATNVANRNRAGTKTLIGPLVNTVVLRTNLGGDPESREVMRRVRATTLAAFAHQDLPFQELTQMLERERLLKPRALANVMILLQNNALRPLLRSGHWLSFAEANPNMLLPLVTITSFDVIIVLRESPDGLAGTCIYKPFLFRASSIDRLLRDFEEVLERMTTQPERPISEMRVSLNELSNR
jgi:acyl-CoA synthetase (AMP-forming)/AMP-acid ligase II/acyl carrier protein